MAKVLDEHEEETPLQAAITERKYLAYAIQKLGKKSQKTGNYSVSFGVLFTDILFEQIFEGLPGTLFGAKGKKMVTYKAPMLLYPNSKDVTITLKKSKTIDEDEVKALLTKFIKKHKKGDTQDNMLFLLDNMHKSFDDYTEALKYFKKGSINTKRKK
mmetsp:Transcript_28544/g.34967  ORF Transcript_28544/g.34967 Transcript_28544/m.34967 type:complete len:157 (+) Transcript_28544:127-597(+)